MDSDIRRDEVIRLLLAIPDPSHYSRLRDVPEIDPRRRALDRYMTSGLRAVCRLQLDDIQTALAIIQDVYMGGWDRPVSMRVFASIVDSTGKSASPPGSPRVNFAQDSIADRTALLVRALFECDVYDRRGGGASHRWSILGEFEAKKNGLTGAPMQFPLIFDGRDFGFDTRVFRIQMGGSGMVGGPGPEFKYYRENFPVRSIWKRGTK
ncbi:MAG: hypothetical protein ABL949_09635 [Fimbriimonadaceae bacterium]